MVRHEEDFGDYLLDEDSYCLGLSLVELISI
jgi:hypothetical protein